MRERWEGFDVQDGASLSGCKCQVSNRERPVCVFLFVCVILTVTRINTHTHTRARSEGLVWIYSSCLHTHTQVYFCQIAGKTGTQMDRWRLRDRRKEWGKEDEKDEWKEEREKRKGRDDGTRWEAEIKASTDRLPKYWCSIEATTCCIETSTHHYQKCSETLF